MQQVELRHNDSARTVGDVEAGLSRALVAPAHRSWSRNRERLEHRRQGLTVERGAGVRQFDQGVVDGGSAERDIVSCGVHIDALVLCPEDVEGRRYPQQHGDREHDQGRRERSPIPDAASCSRKAHWLQTGSSDPGQQKQEDCAVSA